MILPILFFVTILMSSVVAHDADPTGNLVKYLMYGQDKIEYKFKFVSPDTVGYIGSDVELDFGNWTGGTQVSAPIYTRGTIDVGCDVKFYGDFYVDGNMANDGCGSAGTTMSGDLNASGNITGTWSVGGSINDNDASVSTTVPTIDLSTYNYSVNTNTNHQSISSAQTLAPGVYGNLTLNAVVTLQEGEYEFNSITMNGAGGILISKTPGTATRILVKNNFTIAWNTYGIRTDISGGDSYGAALLYLENATSFTTPSGASGFALDLTLLAPKANVTIGTDARLRGQILAKSIVVNNDLNLDALSFQPFDPSGVSLAGAATLSYSEDTDANASTRNSRTIELPVQLSSATSEQATLDYTIRTLSSGSWASGKQAALVGSDTNLVDIASAGGLGTSSLTGTLTFEADSVHATNKLILYLVDDTIPELTAGGIEYFEIKLSNPSKLKFEADPNAVHADDDSLIYIIPIVSEDVANQAPTDLVLASTSLNERSTYSIDITATDSDNSESEMTYTIVGGADQSYFEIDGTTGHLNLKSAAVFENSSGTVQDTSLEVRIQVEDPDGETYAETFTLNIVNRNDEKPNAYADLLNVDEGGSGEVVVSANDNDARDNMTLNGTYSLLGTQGGALYASAVSFNEDTLVYTHDDSENFLDTVWYVLNDQGIINSNRRDTSFVIVSINPLNDNTPVMADQSTTVPENQSLASLLLTMSASDVDTSAGIQYVIISGNSSGLFSLDSDNGDITLAAALDYETNTQHILVIGAISQGDTTTANATINVSNTNEAPQLSITDSLNIDENTLANTIVDGSLSVSDVDNSSFTWTLLDSTYFSIDPSTGEVSLQTDSTLNYEVSTRVEIDVIVNDGSLSDTLKVTIQINDVNDAASTRDTTFNVDEDHTSGVIGTIVTQDEDLNPNHRYSVSSDSIFVVDSLTGAITLQSGVELDYETDSVYQVEVYIQDGVFNDTMTLDIRVNNLVELSVIEIVDIFDSEDNHWTQDDNILTNTDSITVVYRKDGVLDTITYAVEDGLNTLSETYNDPNKDGPSTASVDVKVNTQSPILSVHDNEVPQDSSEVYYVNDLDNDSILVKVQYVDSQFVTREIWVNLPLEDFTQEGETSTYTYTYDDDFGNSSSISVQVHLDTEAPVITITSPTQASKHDSLQVEVTWTVQDGVVFENHVDTVVLTSEKFLIIKSAIDFAGNISSDTVAIQVVMDDSKSEVTVVTDLVRETTEEDILDYFVEKDRDSDPAFDNVVLDEDGDGIPDSEVANISVVNKHNSTLTELQVRTETELINRSTYTETPLTRGVQSLASVSSGMALQIDVSFPMNGGYTQDGSNERRGGFIPDSLVAACGGDSTVYDLSIDDITIHVFDQIGQYVTRVTMPGLSINNTEWQGDDGVVTLLLDIPQLKDGLKSVGRVNLGSGVYIMNGVIRAHAKPKACVMDYVEARSSSTTLLEKVGYQRKELK